jgi:Ca2+-binding EF-hand superfamily protein
MCITVQVFKNKLLSFNNLGMSAKSINRLIAILDEDMEGSITLHEYYNALEAYNCRGEQMTPFDDDPMYANFQHMALFKLVKVLRDRSIASDELFRMIDSSGDNIIEILELKEVLKTFGDFHEKELHSIKTYFDLDNNGSIEESEFMMQLKKAEN